MPLSTADQRPAATFQTGFKLGNGFRQKKPARIKSRNHEALIDYIFGRFFCSQQAIQSRPQDIPLITWYSSQVAGKGLLEAKLRDLEWSWVLTDGAIERKSYVQDILEGRLGQPEGRGAIAKVVSLGISTDGQPYAIVDFGRGYTVGIFLRELSLIEIIHD